MYPFTEGSFAVRNAWYVAAFGNEVGRGLLARTILNQPVVLYRKEDGAAVAVGGRCPHRHFPLGKGCLEGDVVVCGYHGIAFGPDGQCVNIPSQAAIPRSVRIPTYPLVEHGIWLFIWMGDPAKADPALLPDLTEIGCNDPGRTTRPFFTHHIEARYQLLNDNLLDITHIAFLHGQSVGDMVDVQAEESLIRRPGVFISSRLQRDTKGPQGVMRARGTPDALVDRVSNITCYLPGFHFGFEAVLHPRDHPTQAGKPISLNRLYHTVTPATPHSCYYLFAMNAPEPRLAMLENVTRPVIQEDVVALEAIEKMLALTGEVPEELAIKSDRNAIEVRRTLQAMMDAEAAPG